MEKGKERVLGVGKVKLEKSRARALLMVKGKLEKSSESGRSSGEVS